MKNNNNTIARHTISGMYFVKGKGFTAKDIADADVLNQIESAMAKFTWDNVEFIAVK